MWPDLIRALALVCVIEGLMPLLAPRQWRDAVLRLAGAAPNRLRIFGGIMVAVGVVVLRLVHQV